MIADRNMRVVFPSREEDFYLHLRNESCKAFGRMLSDVIRLPRLTESWCMHHISLEVLPRYREMRQRSPGTGVLFVTGHLGSFDLMAFAAGLFGHSAHVVIRAFKNPLINDWFVRVRQRTGNTMISREGATRKMLYAIKRGDNVGILVDQNITRRHAVFIPWFGKVAATTFSPAYIALAAKCPVMISYLAYLGDDQYAVRGKEVYLDDIYEKNPDPSDRHFQGEILLRIARGLEPIIRSESPGWFWFHRRWKTTPEGVPEDFYS
jgi:Kdo2-lipid IVA lauroyltransferase/acyltransferase